MKKLFILTAIFMIAAFRLFAQDVPYNVVFDVTNGEPAAQQRVIVLVNEIIESNANAKIEVVFYGNSIATIDKTKTTVADDISKLAANKNIQFRACSIAMRKHNLDDSGLVTGVQSVPDGIYEIVKKEAAGYAYVKIVL